MSEPENPDPELSTDEPEEQVAPEEEQSDPQEEQAAPQEEEASSESPEERRKTYRLNKVLGATLTSSEGEAKTTRLFIIDISATGFRATDHQPPAEEECEISIVLQKDQEPFQSRMRVVWVKELTVSGMYQMGCEFVDPAPEESQRLEAFLESEKEKLQQGSNKPVSFGRPWTMIN